MTRAWFHSPSSQEDIGRARSGNSCATLVGKGIAHYIANEASNVIWEVLEIHVRHTLALDRFGGAVRITAANRSTNIKHSL